MMKGGARRFFQRPMILAIILASVAGICIFRLQRNAAPPQPGRRAKTSERSSASALDKQAATSRASAFDSHAVPPAISRAIHPSISGSLLAGKARKKQAVPGPNQGPGAPRHNLPGTDDNDGPGSRADNPAAAAAQRRLQMQDEKGYIPPDGLMRAKRHVDEMRIASRALRLQRSAADAAVTPSSWTWLGPGNIGGRVRSIVVNPNTPSTWLAGSVSGGIWQTTNSGGTWAPLDDFMANLAVSTMVMQPGTPSTIYAGTGESFAGNGIQGAGIFKSTDGGVTWPQLASTNNSTFNYVNRLAISPNGGVLLAATQYGVSRSTDGGATFSTASGISEVVTDLAFHPTNSNLAVASGFEGDAWYSTNGGANWTAATGLLPGGTFARVEIAYAPSAPTIVYASVDYNGGTVYKSSDGGATYAALASSPPYYLGGQGSYDNALWVDPTNPNTLIVAGVAMFRTTNGGASWTEIDCCVHVDHHAMVSLPGFNGTTNTTVLFGNDGGVYSTANVYTVGLGSDPAGWVNQNNNLGITQFYGAAGNATTGTIVGGTQDNYTLVYTPASGPQGYQLVAGGDGGYAASDPTDPNYFYGEQPFLTLFRSTNGGGAGSGQGNGDYINGLYYNGSAVVCLPAPYLIPDSCSVEANFVPQANFIAPIVLDPNNPETLLAGGMSLWRTTDAKATNTATTGPSWAAIKAPSTSTNVEFLSGNPISAIAVAIGNSDVCWVGHDDGSIFMTNNCTATSPTWTQVKQNGVGLPNLLYVNRVTIDPADNNRVYVSLGGFDTANLWVTTDGGNTWTAIVGSGSTGLPAVPVFDLAIDPGNPSVLYAATEVGVFTSLDGGYTWGVPQDGPANVEVRQLFWMGSSLVAVTYGRGLFMATFGVNYASSTTTLSVAPSATTYGQSAAFTASVASGGSAVTVGVVTFKDTTTNTELANNVALNSAGQASFAVSNVGAGVHSIQAIYGGAKGFLSSSASTSLTVYPIPAITSLSAASGVAGSSGFTLTVNGSGFLNGLSTVQWNGSPRSTTFTSAYQLTAAINTADLASPGTFNVTVVSTTPGGATSNNAPFTVLATCAFQILVTSSSATVSASTGSVGVLAPVGCTWTAVSNSSLLTVTSGASGSGNGTVGYSVAASSGSTRSGTLTIAGQTFTVTQAVASGPQYTISTFAGGIATVTPAPALSTNIAAPFGLVTDGAGNVYFASNYAVYKVDSGGTLYRVAGNNRPEYAGDGGPAVNAQLSAQGLARDAAGNIYVADPGNNRIRKISPNGLITTYAGTGNAGFSGDGGAATNASLNSPEGVAVDSSGNLYIADTNNYRIRMVTPGGTISTVAGNGTGGFSGDGGAATSAELEYPAAVAVDSSGNLYIGDSLNYRIRKVSGGIITTIAGTGARGYSGDGGPATSAEIQTPQSLAFDASGNLYLADGSPGVRVISPSGIITTVAGNGDSGFFGGDGGDGGPATRATLGNCYGVAVDSADNLYIADTYNYRIRKVSNGTITTIAGNGNFLYSGDGGPAASAGLGNPAGVAVETSGNVYIADTGNNRVRKVAGGTITTIAGSNVPGYSGDGGPAANAQLDYPTSLAVDSSGNLYIADQHNGRIRMISPSGTITTIAGNGGYGHSGDGGAATSAEFRQPAGVAVDASGNVYVADTNNSVVRKFTVGGTITTFAGTGTSGYSGDGGPATSAKLSPPQGVAVDAAGNVYIVDTSNQRIRKVTTNGNISTVAGNGNCCESGDGGQATSAGLYYPDSVSVDAFGNLFIGDVSGQRVRMVSSSGVITTIAGNGNEGYFGDGGPATAAQFNEPSGMALDSSGNIYVADNYNNAVRLLQPLPSPTATAFITAPTSSTYGQSVNLTASVTSGGTAIAAGTVTFADTTTGATLATAIALNSSGQASFSISTLTAGSHAIQASYSGATGIASGSAITTITVAQAKLTVTASNQTVTYGAASLTFTATITGFVNGDTSAVVSGAASLTTNATMTNSKPNAGTWTITPSAGTLSAANYTFGTGTTYAAGALTVNKATLTVAANNLSTLANATLPVLTATVSGLVNSDIFSGSTNTFPIVNNGNTLSGAVTGAVSLATTATSSSAGGSYPINAGSAGLGLSAVNYTINFVPGTLTVISSTRPAFSPVAINFGSQAVGVSSATQTVTVTNIGTNSLTVANVAASGDFSQTNNCATVVTSGTCIITVKFTPSATGSRTGTVSITDNASNSPQTVRLSGVGVSGSAGASVSLSNIDLNFGAQTINTTSAPKTVTLTNSGGAALTVGSISATGSFAQTNNCGSLAASAACTINVTFTPPATGARQGSVIIVDNATGSPQVIHLSGTGTSASAPAIGLSNVSLNFGSQAKGTTSSAQTITVTNTGSATLTITQVATTGDFAASGCVTSLAAGAACTLSVTLTPTVAGARHGTVAITDNAVGSPQVVLLFGNGS